MGIFCGGEFAKQIRNENLPITVKGIGRTASVGRRDVEECGGNHKTAQGRAILRGQSNKAAFVVFCIFIVYYIFRN